MIKAFRLEEEWFKIIGVGIITAAAGVIELSPVGTDIRFALASIILMFALLVLQDLPLIKTGLITSIFVFVTRVIRDIILYHKTSSVFALARVSSPVHFIIC